MPRSLITKHIIETVVNPTLNKSEEEKLRSELNTIFTNASNISFDTPETHTSIQNLAKAFQVVFSKAGVTDINFEKMMTMPDVQVFSELGKIAATQFWDAWNSVAGSGAGATIPIESNIAQQIQVLEKRKVELNQRSQKLDRTYTRYERLSELSTMDYSEFKPLKAEGDLDAQAERVMGEFDRAEDELSKLTRGTKEYNDALIKALDAANNLYRMAQTLNQNKGAVRDKIWLSDYSMLSLSDITADVFDKADRDFPKIFDKFDKYYTQQNEAISTELDSIDAQIKAIQSNNPEIIDQSKAEATLKTLNEIEAAYTRILNKDKSVNKTKSKNILSAIEYTPGDQSLSVLSKGYNKSLSSNENWEIQYQWLVKFVREYEAYLTKINATTDSHKRSGMKATLKDYTPLYEQLKPMAANAENMLRNVLNMANNLPLVGMGGAEAEKNAEATAQEAAAEAAEKERLAQAEAAEAAEKERLAQEAAAEAAEKERLAQEAAAEAAEKERLAQEAAAEAAAQTASAKKGQTYSGTLYHGSKTPLKDATYDPNKGQGRRNVGNGLYFTPDLEQAAKHGKNILQSNIQLDNVFTFTEEFITDIDALYKAMGKVKPANVDWATIKKDLHATMQLPGKAQEFAQNMLKMGYQGMYSKGYGYADPNVEQLVIYDEEYHKGLTTQPYNQIIGDTKQDNVDDNIKKNVEQSKLIEQYNANKEKTLALLKKEKLSYEEILYLLKEYQANYGQNFYQSGHGELGNEAFGIDIDIAKKLLRGDMVTPYLQNALQGIETSPEDGARILEDYQNRQIALAAIKQSQDELNASKAQEPKPVDDTPKLQDENVKLDEQNGKLKENANLKTQASGQGVVTTTSSKTTTTIPTQTTVPDSTISAEVTELEAVRKKVLEVTNAVNTKTQAFKNEATEVVAVVSSEIQQLDNLEKKVATITGLLNNIKTGADIGAGLSNIVVNVNYPNTQQDDLSSIVEAIGKINIQPTSVSDVGNVLATEGTLGAIKTAVESINSKMVKGTTYKEPSKNNTINEDEQRLSLDVVEGRRKSSSPNKDVSDKLSAEIALQKLKLEKFRVGLEKAGRLTDEYKVWISNLSAFLSNIGSFDDMSLWKKAFDFTKTSVGIDDIVNKADAKTEKETFDAVLKFQKKRNTLELEYEKAKDGSELKKLLAEQLSVYNAILPTQEKIVLNEEHEAQLVALRVEHEEKIARIRASKVDAKNAKDTKAQTDELAKLLKLYRELGELDAKWNYADGSNFATEQERKIRDKYREIYKQRALMGLAINDDTYDTEIDTARRIGFTKAEDARRDTRAKEVDKEVSKRRQDEIKRVKQLATEIGKLEAESAFAGVAETQELERQIESRKFYLNLKKEELNLDERELETISLIARQDRYDDLAKQQSKAIDRKNEAEEIKAENAALKEQETIVKNLIDLYRKYGDLQARAENADEGMATWYNNEAKKVEAQILAETQKLDIVTDTMQSKFDSAYATGRDTAESDILKKLYAEEDKTKKQENKIKDTDIEKLAKTYEQLGRAQAQFAQTGNLETEQEINSLERIIQAEKERLNLTNEQIATLESRRNLARADEEEALDAKRRQANRKHYEAEEIREQKRQQQEAEKARKKKLKQDIKEAQEEAMTGRAKSAITKAEGTWIQAVSMENYDVLPDDFKAKLTEYYTQLNNLRDKQNAIKNSDGVISDEQKAELIEQTQNVNKYTAEISELLAEYQRLSGNNTDVIGTNVLGDTSSIDAYKKQLIDAVMAATNGKAQITGFDAATRSLSYTVKTGSFEFTEYKAAVRGLDDALVSVRGTTKKTETIFEGLKRKTKEIFMYLGGSSMIYRAISELRKGLQYVREINSALTELKKVTDETEETYDKFLDTAAKTADKVGSTIQKVVSSTADWARLNI